MRIRRLALVVVACALAAGIAAGSASAIIVRLSNGHYLSYMAINRSRSGANPSSATGHSRGSSGSSTSCKSCDSINHNLDYAGGPVMTSNTNYVIAWIPQGYSGNPFQDAGYDSHLSCQSGDNCGFMYGVAQFFKDLQTDSGHLNYNSDSVATQYNQAGGQTAAYNSHFGTSSAATGPNGVFIDRDPPPGGSGGCAVTATNADGGDASGQGGVCLTDDQIQTELNSFLAAHNLPRGLTNEYFLLTPPDVVTCQDSQGQHCSGNAPQGHAEFCGYHSYGGPSNNGFLYANIVDASGTTTSTFNDGLNGCDPFATDGYCASNSPFVCYYNNNDAEGSLSAVSHEHIESITDPIPPWGWNDDEAHPPDRGGGQEIGDLCNNDETDDSATNNQLDFNNATATPYNYVIGGHHYWLQMEYSNQGATCAHAMTPEAPPGSAFIVASQSGGHVTLNAQPSCGNASCAFNIGGLTWQMDDYVQKGVAPGGLNGLVNSVTCSAGGGGAAGCNGFQISHVFPEPGTYDVALTTQLADGRSWGSMTPVHIYAGPQPSISVHGTRLAGDRLSFSGLGTTHDPSLSITRYAWSFGDGSKATGATPSHTYSRGGTYTVSLTVTDSKGQTGSASGRLTVAAACNVPNVVGKSLSKAKSELRGAGCAVGKVSKPKHKKSHKHLVVASQSISAGSHVAAGTKVNLKLKY